MRDVVDFLDMDITGSTPRFLEAARSLKLKPILLSTCGRNFQIYDTCLLLKAQQLITMF